jgi:hypothetical protein
MFAASVKVTWRQSLDTLTRAFSYDVTQMISLCHDYFDNPRQFGSVKNS